MGYIRHHAIIVTCSESDLLIAAHKKAESLELPVTPIVPVANFYYSFCVVPDGGKEGWGWSNKMNEMRVSFIEWMRHIHLYDWVEVLFGDEQGPAQILGQSGVTTPRANKD